jgi:hypothetical protein
MTSMKLLKTYSPTSLRCATVTVFKFMPMELAVTQANGGSTRELVKDIWFIKMALSTEVCSSMAFTKALETMCGPKLLPQTMRWN